MKKINRIIIALLVLLLVLPLNSVFAESGSYEYVMDYAPLLSDEDARELSAQAAGAAAQYGVGTYIVTVPSKAELDLADYNVADVAEMVYDAWDIGYGSQKDGVMFFLSYEDSEFCVYAYGPKAEQIFTPDICADIQNSFIEDLASSETWYDILCSFLFNAEFEMQWAVRQSSGEDFDYEDYEDYDYDYDDYDVVDYTSGQSARTRSTGGTIDVSDYADEVGSEFFDGANLVSREKLNAFNSRMLSLEKQYGVGIYIITLPDKASLGADGYYIEDLAEALYEASDFGLGDEKTGLLLLMDMGERDYDIMAHGTKGHYAFTDYGKELLANAFLDDFAENEWADGFGHYLDEVERQLMWAEKGEPVDIGSESEKLRSKIGIPGIIGVSLLIGLLFALIVCTHFKNQMKSVRPAASAADFTNDKGVEYSQKADDYLRTTTTTRIIESSSSKGGTSVNSRGYSHSSGKF